MDNFLKLKDRYEKLVITKSWCNVTYPGQQHHKHIHPFSVVSGVVFLDNNPYNTYLTFESKIADVPFYIPKRDTEFSLSDLVGESVDSNNLQNHLVLFLSNCDHRVLQLPKDSKPRRTISFDTFWKGGVGVKLHHDLMYHEF